MLTQAMPTAHTTCSKASERMLIAVATAAVASLFASLRLSRFASRRRRGCAELKKDATAKYRWFGFLSHDRMSCVTEARWLQAQIENRKSDREVYVDTDSDGEYDAAAVADHVRQSKAFVLLQTKGVYDSPHRLYEVCFTFRSRRITHCTPNFRA